MMARDRRAVLIGAGVVAVVLLCGKGLPAGVAWLGRERSRLMDSQIRLATTRLSLAELPRLEQSAHTLTAEVVALAPRLLSGPTEAAALADLSGRLGGIASRHHAQLLGLELRPDSVAKGSLREVSAMATIDTDFRGLAECLAELARDSVVIVPERIEVTAADAMADPKQAEVLHVELVLTGWYLVGRGTT